MIPKQADKTPVTRRPIIDTTSEFEEWGFLEDPHTEQALQLEADDFRYQTDLESNTTEVEPHDLYVNRADDDLLAEFNLPDDW